MTVVSIDVEAGSQVHKFQPVFTFKFVGTAVESQDDGSDKEVPRTFVETFDSPVDGADCHWLIREGDCINDVAYEYTMAKTNVQNWALYSTRALRA